MDFSRSHLDDPALIAQADRHFTGAKTNWVQFIADLAVIDQRRSYLAAGYASLTAFSRKRYRLSRGSMAKLILVARTALKFPILFAALAENRLKPSGVVVLAGKLTNENADELVAASSLKSKARIEAMLRQMARASMPRLVSSEPTNVSREQSPGTAFLTSEAPADATDFALSVEAPTPTPEVFPLHLRMDRDTRDDLLYAQSLLSHQISHREIEKLFGRALKTLIHEVEKKKFGLTSRPRAARGDQDPDSRHISYEVRRQVWLRDGGRCAFVGHDGHRCGSSDCIQFHHIIEWALGGKSTVDNVQLVCRAHNLYEARRTFGPEFMKNKREEREQQARIARARTEREAQAEARARDKEEAQARAEAEKRAQVAAKERSLDLQNVLRNLGMSAEQAKNLADRCEDRQDLPLEDRVKLALQLYGRLRFGIPAPADPAAPLRAAS